jgi:probable phosphoglycerate mutase
MSDSLLRLHVVRHGETAWSMTGQHTGATDLRLTEHGETQARALGPTLASTDFTRVLSSPRQRAHRTCELAGLGARAEIEPDLAEWDYGEYEGLRTSDVRETRPGWTVYRDGCPGGEMPEEIAARADRLITRLASMRGNVALFGHGQFSTVLAARWIGMPPLAAQHLMLDPATLSILTYKHSDPSLRVITLWNAPPT